MAFTKFTRIDYADKCYPVTVDGRGMFHVHEPQITQKFDWDNKMVSAATLDELRKKLIEKIRRQSGGVSVKFCFVQNYRVRYGVARGVHAKSGDVLITWQDSREKDTLRDHTDTLRELTVEECNRVTDLGARVRMAQDAYTTLQAEFDKLIAPFKTHRKEERLRAQIERIVHERIEAEDKAQATNVVPLVTAEGGE